MEEAAEAYVIEEAEGGIGLYRFTHALIQQTLASELSTTRRVRFHALIAEALEEIYADDLEAHAEELAHHYYEAAAMIGPGKMVHYSLLAGEQALATHAYEEALDHFQRALAAKEGQATDSETAALLFGLGKAQMATLERHRMQEALVSLSRAFDFHANSGDVARAVAVAESYPVPPMVLVKGVTPLIAKALALVAPDSHEAGRLLSRYGNAIGIQEADYEAAREAFDDALTIAWHGGDKGLEVRTLVDAARADGFHLRWHDCLEKTLRAIKMLDGVDDPGSEVPARFWAASASLVLGDLQWAKLHASAALAPAERLRHRFWLTVAYWSIGPVARMEGDWETARDFISRGVAIDPQELIFHCQRALIEYEVGDFRQGEVCLEQLRDILRLAPIEGVWRSGFPVVVIPMIARISGVETGLEEAKTAAEFVLSSPSTLPLIAMSSRSALALVAVVQNDAKAAHEQYEVLKSVRAAEWYGSMSTDRLLGLSSHTMGVLDQAVIHFEDGITFCGKAGYRPELAWTCCDFAETLLQRNAPGDRVKAMLLLRESSSISTDLGMRPLMERAQSIQEQAESGPVGASEFPDGLSQREVEVLRLLYLGKSNREIAGDLFISLSTVAHHVSSIFNKTNVSNRTEAATYAARQGLVPQ